MIPVPCSQLHCLEHYLPNYHYTWYHSTTNSPTHCDYPYLHQLYYFVEPHHCHSLDHHPDCCCCCQLQSLRPQGNGCLCVSLRSVHVVALVLVHDRVRDQAHVSGCLDYHAHALEHHPDCCCRCQLLSHRNQGNDCLGVHVAPHNAHFVGLVRVHDRVRDRAHVRCLHYHDHSLDHCPDWRCRCQLMSYRRQGHEWLGVYAVL